jgi:hypothetical protein
MVRLLMLFALLALLVSSGRADEPAKDMPKAEAIPLPRPVTTHILPYYIPSSLPQAGTREIWQYYGVDGTGRWRARVIQSPLGAYYLYNGQPFPWTTTQPGLYMPYVLD